MLTNEQVNLVLKRLNKYNSEVLNKNDVEERKVEFCEVILNEIEEDVDGWNKNCPFSVKTVSEYILDQYITFNGIDDKLYFSCARFLRERLLYLERSGGNESYSSFLATEWSKFLRKTQNYEGNYTQALEDLRSHKFDIDVLNHYLGNRSFKAFLNYENLVVEAENKLNLLKKDIQTVEENIANKKIELENFIDKKKEGVDILANKLEEQETAYNFVGLSHGFEKLLSKKNKSKDKSFRLMVFIGFILIMLPLLVIYNKTIELNNISWEQMLPIFGLEFILIYFFRIILKRYNVIQTQIIQLELRQALCQFIQSYADYSKEIKEKDNVVLEKFENLIFSNILSMDDKLPSTFDGLESITNIIKEFKK